MSKLITLPYSRSLIRKRRINSHHHLHRKLFLILEHADCLKQIRFPKSYRAYFYDNKWYRIDISIESAEVILRDLHLLHAKEHTIKLKLGDLGMRSEETRKILSYLPIIVTRKSNIRLSSDIASRERSNRRAQSDDQIGELPSQSASRVEYSHTTKSWRGDNDRALQKTQGAASQDRRVTVYASETMRLRRSPTGDGPGRV